MANELYSKLAFNGYRVFLIEPPNPVISQPNSHGFLSYHDFDAERIKKVEIALGYFPDPEEIGFWLSGVESRASPYQVEYRPAFVNDGQYHLLWTNPWYAALHAKKISWGQEL